MIHQQSLSVLFRAAASLTPSLQGEIGGAQPGWITPCADSSSGLLQLYGLLVRQHPEAGAPYWSTSLWSHLNWQPAAIAILGIHRFAMLPQVRHMGQRLTPEGIGGFRLTSPECEHGSVEDLIREGGKQLRELADALLAGMVRLAAEQEGAEGFTCLKRMTALRLLADRILSLLVRLGRLEPRLQSGAIQDYGRAWLQAAGLTGMSALAPITLSDGREQLVLQRKACCMNYRCAAGAICESCPTQQSEAVRLRRLRDYWDRHA